MSENMDDLNAATQLLSASMITAGRSINGMDNSMLNAATSIKGIERALSNLEVLSGTVAFSFRMLKDVLQAFASFVQDVAKVKSSGVGIKKQNAAIEDTADDLYLAINFITDKATATIDTLYKKNTITSNDKTIPPLGGNTKKESGLFTAMGGAMKSLGAAIPQLALAMVVMEPIMAMIGAFLEPLEALTPIFEMFGAILSQVLVPIMPPLINLLMALTPAFMAIVEAIMPITNIIVGLINTLLPVIQTVISFIVIFINIIGIITNMFGVLAPLLEWGAAALNGIMVILTGFFDFISNGFQMVIDHIAGIFTGWIDAARDWAKNLFTNGFDGDPNTWW